MRGCRKRMRWSSLIIAGGVAAGLVAGAPLGSALEPEERGVIATLPPPGDHWVWVPDRLFQHSLLYDGDRGTVLGMIDAGAMLTPMPPLWSRSRGEIYSIDTAYTRFKRGERLDYVTIYDARTMGVVGEIPTAEHQMLNPSIEPADEVVTRRGRQEHPWRHATALPVMHAQE